MIFPSHDSLTYHSNSGIRCFVYSQVEGNLRSQQILHFMPRPRKVETGICTTSFSLSFSRPPNVGNFPLLFAQSWLHNSHLSSPSSSHRLASPRRPTAPRQPSVMASPLKKLTLPCIPLACMNGNLAAPTKMLALTLWCQVHAALR